ncbi:MAG: tetratricopeptide repeat protein, partial [Bryobacterales bacterium]|nr:tetratricopeptide repeat protein [Bryobacterales bacterium]
MKASCLDAARHCALKALACMLAVGALAAARAQAEEAPALTDRGLALAQGGRPQEAAKLWRQALEESPGYFPALFNLGYMHFSAGRFAQAAPLLERAAAASPNDFNAHYLRGAAAQKLGRGDEALRAWRSALRLKPGHFKLMQVMAVEFGKGRYHREAADIAMRALRLQPEIEDLHYMAIHACREAGNLGAGLGLASRAAKRF